MAVRDEGSAESVLCELRVDHVRVAREELFGGVAEVCAEGRSGLRGRRHDVHISSGVPDRHDDAGGPSCPDELERSLELWRHRHHLGLGTQPPDASWGYMLSSAQNYIWVNPLLGVYPGLLVMLTVLAVNFVGEGIRDALDPRLTR